MFYRAENKETIQVVLSEDSKIKRRRRNKVNLQMTVFSWSLEFITGLVLLSINIKIHNPETNVDFITCMVIFDAFLNFIIIPSSYILNNEVLKKFIMAEGWCKFFKCRRKTTKIDPDRNAAEVNDRAVANVQPIPIPTVLGNIKALAPKHEYQKEDLKNDFMMLTANQLFAKP